MTTKLIHTADIHLDSPLRSLALRSEALREQVRAATRGAFARIVDMALEQGAAAVLISGDLYDGAERSARTAAFLAAEFDRLDRAGVAVFCIRGNHDAENPLTGEVTLPGNVHVFDGRGGRMPLGDTGIWIHGVSFSGRHAPESLLRKFPAPVEGAVNIAMLHSSLAGAPGHDVYAPCTVAELAAMGFDYWALGHVHRRQVHSRAPWIVMPGMPQGRDIGEAGPKSATLLTVADGRIAVAELPTARVEFAALEIDIAGLEDEDALRRRLRAGLAGCLGPLVAPHAILRVRLAGAGALGWRVLRDRAAWTETLHTLAAETGRLWVEKVEFHLGPPAPAAAAGGADATAELHGLMEAIRAEPGFAAQALAEVEAMLGQLPPDRMRELWTDEAAPARLADRLAQAGIARMVALMKGTAP